MKLMIVLSLLFLIGCSSSGVRHTSTNNPVSDNTNFDLKNDLNECRNSLTDCNEIRTKDMNLYFNEWKDCKNELESYKSNRVKTWIGCEGDSIVYFIKKISKNFYLVN